MFTGLIEEIGTVRRIERGAKGARLTIAANTVLENTKIGDSIATNGVCLTVVALTDDSFSADVMAELTAPVPLPMPSAHPSMSALPE